MILASRSPRRKELLSRCGVEFSIFEAQIKELQAGPGVELAELPLQNALLKAEFIAAKFPQELVLGADTMVICDGKAFGKPASDAESFQMLSGLSGKTHQVITGMALISEQRNIRELWSETTLVHFKKLAPQDIKDYMAKVYTLDKAGAYAIQEHAEMIIDSYDGELENVIGLPLEHLQHCLQKFL